MDQYFNSPFWEKVVRDGQEEELAYQLAHLPPEKMGLRFPGGTVSKKFRYPRDNETLDDFVKMAKKIGVRNLIYVCNLEAPNNEIKQIYQELLKHFANVVVEIGNEEYMKQNLGLNFWQQLFFPTMAKWILPNKARKYYKRGKEIMKHLGIPTAVFCLGGNAGLYRYWNQEIKMDNGIVVARHWYPEPNNEWWNQWYKEVAWLAETYPGQWMCSEGAGMNFGFEAQHRRNTEFYGTSIPEKNLKTMKEFVEKEGCLAWVDHTFVDTENTVDHPYSHYQI